MRFLIMTILMVISIQLTVNGAVFNKEIAETNVLWKKAVKTMNYVDTYSKVMASTNKAMIEVGIQTANTYVRRLESAFWVIIQNLNELGISSITVICSNNMIAYGKGKGGYFKYKNDKYYLLPIPNMSNTYNADITNNGKLDADLEFHNVGGIKKHTVSISKVNYEINNERKLAEIKLKKTELENKIITAYKDGMSKRESYYQKNIKKYMKFDGTDNKARLTASETTLKKVLNGQRRAVLAIVDFYYYENNRGGLKFSVVGALGNTPLVAADLILYTESGKKVEGYFGNLFNNSYRRHYGSLVNGSSYQYFGSFLHGEPTRKPVGYDYNDKSNLMKYRITDQSSGLNKTYGFYKKFYDILTCGEPIYMSITSAISAGGTSITGQRLSQDELENITRAVKWCMDLDNMYTDEDAIYDYYLMINDKQ